MSTDKILSNTEIKMIMKFFSEFEDVQFNTKEELYTTVHNIVRNDYHFVYLIFKLLRRTPKPIFEQYIKIINCYSSKEKYQKEYVDLCKKFETDLLFKRYAEFNFSAAVAVCPTPLLEFVTCLFIIFYLPFSLLF